MVKTFLSNCYYRFRPSHVNFFGCNSVSELATNDLCLIDQSSLNSNLPLLEQASRLAGLPSESLAARINAGHQLFVSLKDNNITGYYWFSSGPTTIPWEKDLDLKLEMTQAYIWDCKVSQTFRNQGIYGRSLREIVSRHHIKGTNSIFIYCRVENLPSSRAILKNGFNSIQCCTVQPLPFKCAILFMSGSLRFVKNTVNLADCISR
jgi:hypothetical protein